MNSTVTIMQLKVFKCLFFYEIASWLVILCYNLEKNMSNTQAKKLSLKFVPYFFVAVTILTAFGANAGIWVWKNLILVV